MLVPQWGTSHCARGRHYKQHNHVPVADAPVLLLPVTCPRPAPDDPQEAGRHLSGRHAQVAHSPGVRHQSIKARAAKRLQVPLHAQGRCSCPQGSIHGQDAIHTSITARNTEAGSCIVSLV